MSLLNLPGAEAGLVPGPQLALIAPPDLQGKPAWWATLPALGVAPSVVAVHRDAHATVIRVPLGGPAPERAHLDAFAQPHGLDIAVLNSAPRWPAVMVFDMDSTLIHQECIDELAKLAGSGEQVAAITEAAMRGELDFDGALRARVATLRELPLSAIDRVRAALTLQPGIDMLAERARSRNVLLALVSGGFVPFAEHIRSRLGFQVAKANQLADDGQHLTGTVAGQIVNAEVKAQTLRALAAQQSVDLDACVAVGDGANDRPMAEQAGFSIAFRAKPALRAVASLCLDHADFRAVISLFDSGG